MNIREKKKFYVSQIEDRFVPYWLSFTDDEHGGIYTSISNDGNTLYSKDKFIWSQGRWLYILSKLIEMKRFFKSLDYERIFGNASMTASFLISHSFDSDYCTVFRTKDDGTWVKDDNGDYFSSIYADAFSVIGLAEYSKVTRDRSIGLTSEKIMDSMLRRIDQGGYKTAPYEIPSPYKSHGIPMIIISTLRVLSSMKESFSEDVSRLYREEKKYLDLIFSLHYDRETNLIREYVSPSPDYSRLLDRHINPGHTLEDAWFWIESMESQGVLSENIALISDIIKKTFDISWDNEYGGLFRFVDRKGGKPKGKTNGSSYECLVKETWNMKLWWPHSEMLYLFLKMFFLTGDDEYLSLYKKVEEYTFSTFPSDKNTEWVQIRNRKGEENDRVVALPVKDPFHILRDFLKIVMLLEEHDAY